MEWLIANKEWLLSGILVSIPIAVVGWFFAKKGNLQKQKSGKGSTNIQVGKDFSINSHHEKDGE